MSSEVSVRTGPEPFVREFLRLLDEGWEPDLEEYLGRLPEAVRDKVFQRLDEELEQRSEASWDENAAEEEVEEERSVAEPEVQSPPQLPPRRREPQPLGFRPEDRLPDRLETREVEPVIDEPFVKRDEEASDPAQNVDIETAVEMLGDEFAGPSVEEPAPVEPAPVEPSPVEPSLVEPSLVEPSLVEPAPEAPAEPAAEPALLEQAAGEEPAAQPGTDAESPLAAIFRNEVPPVQPVAEPVFEEEAKAPVEDRPALASWPSLDGYRIESELGRGSLGDAYLAWDESGRRKVVLKFLFDELSEKVSSRVMREAEKVATLGAFGLHAAEAQVGNALVAPYLEGATLDGVDAGIELLLAVARRLEAAHAGGVLHLDLRPQNVLVADDGNPVLLDVGVGASVLSVPASSAWLGGLPHYESPEHANRLNLSPKSDVFSFGTLMYRALTGELPFPGGAVEKIRERVAKAEPKPPRVIDESIAPELQDVCLSCFARKPSDRPTMTEVAEDLERFLDGRPVRLRPRYYRDVLRKRVREVITEVRGWRAQGLARDTEAEKLETVCKQLLAREEQWTHDPARTPRLTRVLPMGSLLYAVAAGLVVRFGYAIDAPVAWILPLAGTVALLAAGVVAAARNERPLAAPLLAGGLLALLPSLAGLFQGIEILGASATLVPGLSWLQFAVAAGAVFLASVGLLAWRREAIYAVCTCVAFAATYVGAAGVFGFFGQGVLALFPLAALLLAARQFEVHERYDWARPFFLAGLAALVGVPLYVSVAAVQPLWIAASGAGFLLAAGVFERSGSASIRATARWLEAFSPGVVMAGLCVHAGLSLAPLDWVFALGAAMVLIAHGAVLRRRSTFLWGLAGMLCAAAMPALFGLMTPWIYASILGGLGLLATVVIAVGSLRSREP